MHAQMAAGGEDCTFQSWPFGENRSKRSGENTLGGVSPASGWCEVVMGERELASAYPARQQKTKPGENSEPGDRPRQSSSRGSLGLRGKRLASLSRLRT